MLTILRKISDKDILLAIKEGKDDRVLSYLYKEVLPQVKNYVMRNGGSEEEGKDIFQDAVIRFYNSVKQGNFQEKCSISTFVIGISRNLWINAQRTRNRYITMEDNNFRQDSVNLLEEIITSEKISAMNEMLKDIGEMCEKILRLSVYDNLSMKEIAEKMGFLNENVAKSNNYRCKKKLLSRFMERPDLIKLFDR